MRRFAVPFAALLALVTPCRAQDAKPAPAADPLPEEIVWLRDVPAAFAQAKTEGKPMFLAINAAFVDGGKAEPAGRELRDNTYKAKEVVARSHQFVCVLLKPDGTSADYAELRSRFGMDGLVVSPQHIFAHADGALIEPRHEYWPHAHGQPSVDALLKLMDTALAAHKAKTGAGASAPVPDAAASVDQRAAWIREQVAKLRDTELDPAARELAGTELIKGDQKGDCLDPLCTFLLEAKKETELQIALVRAMGKPGLEFVVPTLCQLLEDKHEELRSNAAVTLEYVGSVRAVEPLVKRISREKDEFAWNNCCRALGRCGAKQEAVRKLLLREATSAKSDKLSAGPAIGLAYFERDVDAARGVEKIVEKGSSWQKRAFLLYALTEIRDPKSADFVKEKVLKNEKNPLALGFLNGVVGVLTGADETGTAQSTVENGVGFAVGSVGGVGGPARIGRDQAEFKPKGEFQGRGGPGGGPGGRGGGPGMGG